MTLALAGKNKARLREAAARRGLPLSVVAESLWVVAEAEEGGPAKTGQALAAEANPIGPTLEPYLSRQALDELRGLAAELGYEPVSFRTERLRALAIATAPDKDPGLTPADFDRAALYEG